MSEIIIRLATQKDVIEISNLWLKMVNELHPEYTPNILWWQKMCINLFKTGIYKIVIAQIKDKIVGFIDGMSYPEPSTGKIHGIAQHFYILPEHRETIIAFKLYKKIIALAKEKNVQILEFFCFEKDIEKWLKKQFNPQKVMMVREL